MAVGGRNPTGAGLEGKSIGVHNGAPVYINVKREGVPMLLIFRDVNRRHRASVTVMNPARVM